MNNTFDETIAFLMDLELHKNLLEIYQDDKIRCEFFSKLEDMAAHRHEHDAKELENISTAYLADIEKINFISGFKIGFLFFEEMKRGCFNG